MSAFYEFHPLHKQAFQVQGPSTAMPETPAQQTDPLQVVTVNQQQPLQKQQLTRQPQQMVQPVFGQQ